MQLFNYNVIDNQVRHHLLDQLRSLECYHMLLNYFYTGSTKKFRPSITTLVFFISTNGG